MNICYCTRQDLFGFEYFVMKKQVDCIALSFAITILQVEHNDPDVPIIET